MSNVSFSFTKQVIIHLVLRLRAAPLDTLDDPLTTPERISHFFQSEVTTRIIAIATSFFAAIDFMAHLGTGIVKGAHLGLRKLGIRRLSPAPTGEEIAHHFKQSAKFLGITIIGSIAATVFWPGVLKYFRVSPFSPEETDGGDWKNTSETVQNLWSQTADKVEFKKLWKKASIHDQRTFVHLLNGDSSTEGIKAKLDHVGTVYRKIADASNLWPKQKDTPIFYHATSLQGIEGILTSGKIEVRHEQAYDGAFVSMLRPETGFGRYIFVFNRNIERLSRLNHGFSVIDSYWVGYSHDIPVNATTLLYILVEDATDREISDLELFCSDLAGRKIEVKKLSQHKQINVDKDTIPEEWPGGDPNAAAILKTMTVRAQQIQMRVAQQQAPKAVSVPVIQKKQSVQKHRMMMVAH